jgi:hypothetical protein
MIGETRPDQFVAFTRLLDEAWPIAYRDVPLTSLDHTRTFQFPDYVRDRWPVHAQHFGKQIVGDGQPNIVAAITHHEQPTRKPFLEAVGAVARDRHHDLLRIAPMERWNAARDIVAAVPGIRTNRRAEELWPPNTACTPVQPSLPMVAISMTLPLV